MLREIVEGVSEKKIYFVKDELWLAYGQGSGRTSQFPDLTKSINNKSGDKNFDSNVTDIVKWTKFNKPMKANKEKTTLMYELPVYDLKPRSFGQTYNFDVWGGDTKATKKYYMVVSTDGVAVVNIFAKKNEALAWVRGA